MKAKNPISLKVRIQICILAAGGVVASEFVLLYSELRYSNLSLI
jgi:hypothetical protein